MLTVLEVYSKCIEEVRKYKKIAEQQKDDDDKEIFYNYAEDFMTCAGWLEQTREVNPPRSIRFDKTF